MHARTFLTRKTKTTYSIRYLTLSDRKNNLTVIGRGRGHIESLSKMSLERFALHMYSKGMTLKGSPRSNDLSILHEKTYPPLSAVLGQGIG